MYFTGKPRNDGFGAQFQNIIIDILCTYEATNHKYVFPNITSFEHNYTNEPDFTERLIQYMNLRNNYKAPEPNIIIHHFPQSNYPFFENNITRLLTSQTMKLIKSLFYANKKTPFDEQYYNVAVHVRRPNKDDMRINGADTPHSYYMRVMNYIRRNHSADKKPIRFHIYSQTTNNNVAEFEETYLKSNTDTELHLNGDVLPAFHGMVFADALVCSASSYSYCASFLSNGTIYYKKFWHKPAGFWVIGDDLLQ